MVKGVHLCVEYVDMTPTQHALWRQQLAALFTYVAKINVKPVSVPIADSRIVAPQTTALPIRVD
jgi:hypothetical protein